MTLVREYMASDVISVGEDTALDAVVRTLDRNNVSVVLVTDAGGGPVGVVSMTDLFRASKLAQDGPRKPFRLMPPELRARDVMQKDIISVEADVAVGEAATQMLSHKIHRVFVTEGKRVVGVFSTRDAMRVVMLRQIATPLRDVMSSPAETIEIGATIASALEELDDADVRGLAVVDGKVPVGLFTHLEAIKARALPPELLDRPVEEVMSYETSYLEASTPLYRAAGHAIATGVRRILVTEARALVGIVSGYDLARVLIES